MDRIQLQASKLWDRLFSDETGQTYQNALNLTGTILKESAQLIWLIICSVFVFGAWFSDASVKTGNSLRSWIEEQGDSSAKPGLTDSTAIADKGKNLLETGRVSVANLLSKAREELGLEPLPPEALKKKIKPVVSTPPESKPEPEPESEPVAAVPVAPTASPAAIATPTPTPEPSVAATPSLIEEEEEDESAVEEVTREAVDDEWPPSEEE